MRWIQRRPLFPRTATASRSGSKNVPDSAIFKPTPTDTFISMSPCANQNLFGRNSSPQSIPECIPYKCLEQTAPSLIPGQLKSWKSAKSVKLGWKPHYLHEFLCDSHSVSTESKRSMDTTIHAIQSSWTDNSFLKRWSVEYPKINKKAKMKWKTTTTSWVQVRSGWFLISGKALVSRYNSSHTMVLVRYLLPRCVRRVNSV